MDAPRSSKRFATAACKGTRLIAEAIAHATTKPAAFICASAIGYYGDRGDELLTESSPPGHDFLAEVCREWEAACQPARDAGVRVVNARIGVVLSPEGGALAKMLTPFKLGLGGTHRRWPAVHELDRAGRRGRRDSVSPRHADCERPGQFDGPEAGDQRRVH